MIQDLRGPYKEALKKVEDGELFVTHVGLYEDRTVIVLFKDKVDKSVKVIDMTDHPGEAVAGKLEQKQAPPSPPEPPEEPPIEVISESGKYVCGCGKKCSSASGLSRHQKKCSG